MNPHNLEIRHAFEIKMCALFSFVVGVGTGLAIFKWVLL